MTGDSVIVDATPQHDDGVVAVALAHGFAGSDTAVNPAYRRFVASHGRLVVALDHGEVVGFGGAIDVDDSRLVTDLFLLADHQGRGHGGAMLRALVGPFQKRFTFSSAHERAAPSYARMGMTPRWRLQYWTGRSPAAAPVHAVSEVAAQQWQGDRPELAAFFSAQSGRLLHIHDGDRLVGWAILIRTGNAVATWTIARLSTDLTHDRAMRDVLAFVPPVETVLVCVPDRSIAGVHLEQLGFEVVDQDICCATDGAELPSRLAAVHPGVG